MDYVLASYLAWQGQPVRRAAWPRDVYVCLKGASPHIFAPKTTPTVWHYTLEDFRAKDYERYHTGLCRSKPSHGDGTTGNSEGLDPIANPLDEQSVDDSA